MRRKAKRTMTARDLEGRIERLSWKRLTDIYLNTRSQAVRKMIEKEAHRYGYRMSGFILAQALNRQSM